MEKKSAIVQQANRLSDEKDNLEKLERKALVQVFRVLLEKYPAIETEDGTIVHAYDLANVKNEVVTLSEERLAECLGVQHKSPKKHTESIKNALRSLSHKACEIPPEKNGGKWLAVNWINYAEHNPETNQFEVEVSKKVVPYLLNLTKSFTQYDAYKIFNLHNKYSMRFYEKCCQFKKYGCFYMTEEEIRDSFGVYKVEPGTDKRIKPMYTQSHQFVKNVIELPQKELKEKFEKGLCDFYFDFIATKYAMGKSHPTKWYFSIGYKGHPADTSKYKETKQLQQPAEQNLFGDNAFLEVEEKAQTSYTTSSSMEGDTNIKMIEIGMRNWFPNDGNADFRSKILQALYKKSVPDVQKIMDNIQRISREHPGEDRIRVLRHMFNKDVLKRK